MAEDIDDLLEEVESKFLTKDKKQSRSKNNRKEKRDNEYDIDDLLDDIKVEPIPKTSVTSVSNDSTDFRPASGKKCFPVYLGGSSCSQGMANSFSQRACDKLRCTSCDFKVCSFDNFEWHSDTDYLFLRNNVPDFHRLKSNLAPKNGCRAYCCQCSHRSVQKLTQLSDPQLKWVCGKHWPWPTYRSIKCLCCSVISVWSRVFSSASCELYINYSRLLRRECINNCFVFYERDTCTVYECIARSASFWLFVFTNMDNSEKKV